MPRADYAPGAVAGRGKEISQQHIRDKVEPRHKGKFWSIAIETGDYEIDASVAAPTLCYVMLMETSSPLRRADHRAVQVRESLN